MYEAYKIGVRLSLINNVTSGLAVISGGFKKTSDEAKALQSKLKEIKLMGAVGFGIGAAGFMGLGIIGKMVKPAEEYVHQLRLANQQGFTHAEMIQTQKRAWDTLKTVPTSKVSSNIEAIRDLSTVLTSREHAINFMPTAQKTQAILETYLHGQPGSYKNEVGYLGKLLEMKGWVQNEAQMEHATEGVTRAIVATGGKVTASDFLSAVKYGRKSGLGWDLDFMQNYLPTIIQEMKSRGGSGVSAGAGPALQAMGRVVIAGIAGDKAFELFNKLGLLDKSKIHKDKQGNIKSIGPGGMIGSELFKENPYYWARDILSPALTAAGITKPNDVSDTISHLFKTGTADFMVTQMVMQQWKFERDAQLFKKALPNGLTGGYSDLAKNDPVLARVAFAAQVDALKVALGQELVPVILGFLEKLNIILPKVSHFINEHTTAFKILTLSFAGFSAGLAMAGGAIGISAAFTALKLGLKVLTGTAGISSLEIMLGKAHLLGSLMALIPMAYEASKAMDYFGAKTFDKNHDANGNPTGSAFNKFVTGLVDSLFDYIDYGGAAEKGYAGNPGSARRWGLGNRPDFAAAGRTKPEAPTVIVRADRRGLSTYIAGGISDLMEASSTSGNHIDYKQSNIPMGASMAGAN